MGSVKLTWDNAVLMGDGSNIPNDGDKALKETIIRYSKCASGELNRENFKSLTVPPEDTEVAIHNLSPGQWCFVATHSDFLGVESDESNLAQYNIIHTILDDLDSNINFTTSDELVYTVVKQRNKFILIPVGVTPVGTECDPNQFVNGFYVVPVEKVEWASNVEPSVVVAKC